MLRFILTLCATFTLTLSLAQTAPQAKPQPKLSVQDTTQPARPEAASTVSPNPDSSSRTMTAQRYLSSSMLWAAPEPKKP